MISLSRMMRARRRARRKKIEGSVTRKFINQFKYLDEDYPPMSNQEVLLGTTDYRDFYIVDFVKSRVEANISTVIDKIIVRGNHKAAQKLIEAYFMDCLIFDCGSDRIVITDSGERDMIDRSIIEIDISSNTIEFRLHGTYAKNKINRKIVLSMFEEITIYINWIYDANMNSATVPIDTSLVPVDEMYPWLNGETLESYYQRFLESRSSILILIGPPGTGKCLDPEEEIEIMISDEIYEKLKNM